MTYRKPTPLSTAALLAIAFLVSAGSLSAQNPDFAGSWTADLERSDPIMPNGQKLENSYRLTLQGDDLDVTRTFTVQGQSNDISWRLITNGELHEIPGWRGPREVRAKWKKDKLSVSYTMSTDTPRGSFDLDVTEQWKINKKGELEIIYVTRMPQRSITRTEIFTRDEG